MKNHKFIYSETIGKTKIYLVKCKKTGGDFSTILWFQEKIKKNLCPCCEKIIKNNGKP